MAELKEVPDLESKRCEGPAKFVAQFDLPDANTKKKGNTMMTIVVRPKSRIKWKPARKCWLPKYPITWRRRRIRKVQKSEHAYGFSCYLWQSHSLYLYLCVIGKCFMPYLTTVLPQLFMDRKGWKPWIVQFCCEYTNIFPFSPLFEVSMIFLISFDYHYLDYTI